MKLVRTLGVSGTRFTAHENGAVAAYIEVDTGVSGTGRIASHEGWADIGNLHVAEEYRGRGVGTWLIGQAAEWLRMARIHRLLDYATPEEADRLAFLERVGFRRLTETAREWDLRV
jgi:GNAT superfamily N-acetyltransferase